MATPATANIRVMRGDTEIIIVTVTGADGVTPINITGRSYSAQIRYERNSPTIAATFACVVSNGAAGQVTLTLSAIDSATLTDGAAFWDLQENNAGIITTVVAGKCTILADVTR
jgi:hypothetical protein